MSYAGRVLARVRDAGRGFRVAPRPRSVYEEWAAGPANPALDPHDEAPAPAGPSGAVPGPTVVMESAPRRVGPREVQSERSERDRAPADRVSRRDPSDHVPVRVAAVSQAAPAQPPGADRVVYPRPESATRPPLASMAAVASPGPSDLRAAPSMAKGEPPSPRRAEASEHVSDLPSRPSVSPSRAAEPTPAAGVRPRAVSVPMSTDRPAPSREPDVIVTIGRVELRAVVESAPSARPARGSAAATSLDDYLRRGAKGRT